MTFVDAPNMGANAPNAKNTRGRNSLTGGDPETGRLLLPWIWRADTPNVGSCQAKQELEDDSGIADVLRVNHGFDLLHQCAFAGVAVGL